MYKRHKVVMLPTNKKANGYYNGSIIKHKNGDLLRLDNRDFANNDWKAQHLYIISDDEIQEGDWVKLYVKHINKEWIHQVTKQDLLDYPNFNNEGAKIVATTDKSLTIKVGSKKVPLPQPSKAFIKKYCELGGIDEVLVEYVTNQLGTSSEFLKVSDNNNITIRAIDKKKSIENNEVFIVLTTSPQDKNKYNITPFFEHSSRLHYYIAKFNNYNEACEFCRKEAKNYETFLKKFNSNYNSNVCVKNNELKYTCNGRKWKVISNPKWML